MLSKSLLEKLKEVGSHSIIYGLGGALQSILGFILIPLYTRYFSADLYGVFALITLVGTLAGSVFYLGASSALSRSYYDYSDMQERKKVISTSFYITLIGAFLQIFAGVMVSKDISVYLFKTPAYLVHIQLILISSAITFINNLFYLILRFERKSKEVVFLNLASLILTTALIFVLIAVMKLGVMAPILGSLIIQVLLFGLLLFMMRNYLVLDYHKAEVKIQLMYGFPQMISALGYYLLNWVDRLFINRYCTLDEVGIYSLGHKLGMIIHIILIIPFSQIWAPMRLEYRHDADARKFSELVLTYYFIIGFFFTVGISVFARELLIIMAGRPEYLPAYKVVPLVMLAHLFYGTINIVDSGLIFERKVSYHAYLFFLTLVINIMLNYLLIPYWGYMAAAYSTLISYMILVVSVIYLSNKLYAIPCEVKRVLLLLASSLIVMLLSNLSLAQERSIGLLFKAVLYISLLSFWYIYVINEREKHYLWLSITSLLPSRLKSDNR
jgi:O-antigen/teichoic acid export membrane protein